jgi:hypothetical protein
VSAVRTRTVVALVAVVASRLFVSGVASADEPVAKGIEVGLRTGYSIPFGIADPTGNINKIAESDLFTGRIPLWLDVGYRVSPHFLVGAYVTYGVLLINGAKTGCNQSDTSCSAHDLSFGIDAHYHLLPDRRLDPWFGIGFASEALSKSITQSGQSTSASKTGIQFFNVQTGLDYKVAPNLGVGPFVMLSVGEYSVQDAVLHEWLTIGVRGAYDINL